MNLPADALEARGTSLQADMGGNLFLRDILGQH